MKPLRRLFAILRGRGFRQFTVSAYSRLVPPRLGMRNSVVEVTHGKYGLEVGGPSRIFRRSEILPIYSSAARIDNVNFATRTTWEDELVDRSPFHFDDLSAPGVQLIREAKSLTGVPAQTFDFVISSHCLEHLADPISALKEWSRVTKRGGHLVVAVPNPQQTFDHRRPITSIKHLVDDHRRKVEEDDLTHLPEILSLHDLNWDRGATSPAGFRERSLRNAEIRCLHHHVFDPQLLRAVLEVAGWEVLTVECVRPIHIIALAKNTAPSLLG